MTTLPRLDVLLYAHDGRGLGHASRSIAIGMALRRLSPFSRVLFVSGCKVSQDLIGAVPMDWLKLPSYETEVVDGKSRGRDGFSNYSDQELGYLRGEELKTLFLLYRPRVVVVDHSPQGKHRELIPLLESKRDFSSHCILGIRGVIGEVSQVQATFSQQLFKKNYHGLFWYGDSGVLGTEHRENLKMQFGQIPVECGYVSRLAELQRLSKPENSENIYAGTVSIPWLGEKSLGFLQLLGTTLKNIGPSFGKWRLFIGGDSSARKCIVNLFRELSFCQIEEPGRSYSEAVSRSKVAIIYGGYNSLMDILHLGIPAMVLLRSMVDNEQQLHLQALKKNMTEQLSVHSEELVGELDLESFFTTHLMRSKSFPATFNLDGAQIAAEHILKKVSQV